MFSTTNLDTLLVYTSMEPCLGQILHSAEYFNFWIRLRTIQGITLKSNFPKKIILFNSPKSDSSYLEAQNYHYHTVVSIQC